MDLTATTAPKSDQQNYDDYIAGPKTVTISEVTAGSAEQPVDIHLVEFPGRPFRPSKTVRRILVAAWGPEASAYSGRRMTLFGDPTIRFGGAVVGGIRVSHLSHIDKPLTLSLTTTRGKRAPFTVQPLKDTPAAAPDVDLETVTDLDALAGMWKKASPERRKKIEARVAAIKEHEAGNAAEPVDAEPQPFDGRDPWATEVQA